MTQPALQQVFPYRTSAERAELYLERQNRTNFLFTVKIQKLKDSFLYNVYIGIELTVSDKYLPWL